MSENSTYQQYSDRARSIIRRACKDCNGQTAQPSDSQLVAWLSCHQDYFKSWICRYVSTWSPSTRRQYKAALAHFLGHDIADSISLDVLFLSKVSKTQLQKNIGKRTSARKAKQMSSAQWRYVEDALCASKSSVAGLIQKLLLASRSFGLRPVEWAYAELTGENDIFYLTAQNAKNTQGRSFGRKRTLILDMQHYELLPIDLNRGFSAAYQLIAYFEKVRLSVNTEEEYRVLVEQGLKQCRYYLAAVNRKLEAQGLTNPNKRITLYSGRHQFAADAKKAGLSPLEIAALMGHGALDTQTKHYGRKNHGQGGFHLQASTSDIQAILNRNANKSSPSL